MQETARDSFSNVKIVIFLLLCSDSFHVSIRSILLHFAVNIFINIYIKVSKTLSVLRFIETYVYTNRLTNDYLKIFIFFSMYF